MVGVPSLDGTPGTAASSSAEVKPPIAPPSATQVNPAPPTQKVAEEANTAVDVKAISQAEADRVLQWTGFTQEEIPTAKGPDSKPPRPPSIPAKVAAPTIQTVDPRATARGVAPPPLGKSGTIKGTPKAPPARVSSKPPAPPKGRATLVDSGEAAHEPLSSTGERPPIVVPAAGARQPKAVTQPPPWTDGAAHVAGTIPAASKVPAVGARPPMESVEELSGSVLLPELADADDEDLIATRRGDDKVEELSGSILLPDDSAPPKNAPKPKPKSTPPPPPPVRASAAPAPAPPTVKGHAPLTAPFSFTPQASVAHPPAPPPPTPAPPVTAPKGGTFPPPFDAPVPPPAVASAPAPTPVPAAVPAPVIATKTLESPRHDPPPPDAPALPPGVPIPEPPPIITHEAWPPPHVDPPASVAPSAPPPAAAPFGGPSSAPPPPHTTPAPDPKVDWSDRLEKFFPASSILRTRPKWFLPTVIGGGAIVFLGLVGLVCGGLSKATKSSSESSQASSASTTTATTSAKPAASAAPTQTASAASAPSAAKPIAPEPPTPPKPTAAPSNAPCTVAGSAHVVAPRAIVGAGVEALALGSSLALGFAPSDRDGIAVMLDPSSLGATKTVKAKAGDTIKRLSPMLDAKGSMVVAADTDKRGDKIRGRRVVVGESSFDFGFNGADVVAAPRGSSTLSKLWPLEGDGTPDAVRGASIAGTDEKSYAVAFRRGNAIFAGVASGADKTLAAKGALLRFDGTGDKVGSPAIAASGDAIMVAWADHASDGTWKLRTVRFRVGEASPSASTFPVPPGGLGQHAMSPGLVGLPGGRFVIVWTEGPGSSFQVRAQTIGPSGDPIGAPMAISADGVFAGQGQVAIAPDGHGVVAFLGADAPGSKKFDVRATPITCPM